jgi:FkbM family methyltransferase
VGATCDDFVIKNHILRKPMPGAVQPVTSLSHHDTKLPDRSGVAMDFSNPAVVRIRSLGRHFGVFPPLVRAFRRLAGSRYEERFDASLAGAVRAGDTVWDIGANQGLYTEKFAAQVGEHGRVLAFEPSPDNIMQLRNRFPEGGRVTLCPVALADRPGIAKFYCNLAEGGTTDSLVARTPKALAHEVAVRCGDEFLAAFPPNVIKIDVEGFELEVVRGLRQVLASASLRSILIEVHFSILSDRGLEGAPTELTALLRAANLTVAWVDASHLIGERAAQV